MSLSCFRNIRSAYHTEFGESEVGDKCHQLIFIIQCINRAAARAFDFVPNEDFDEGGIETRSFSCCVQQYNKYKPGKIRIGFFVLADSKYYFVQYRCFYGYVYSLLFVLRPIVNLRLKQNP